MKTVIVMAALALVTGGVFAADEKKPPSEAQKAQQEKMRTCNAEAKEKAFKGDERKQFMSACLGSKPANATTQPDTAKPAAATAQDTAKPATATQQDKMKTCNADASSKGLKGDERKKFISECLKAS